jgi:hypothetical protein
MKQIVLAAARSAIVAVANAQNSTRKQPTMAETVAWLTTDAAPLLTYTSGPKPGRPGPSRRSIHDLRIVDCRMGWEDSNALNLNASTGKAEKVNTSTYRAPLGDLDVAGIHLRTFPQDKYVIVEFGPRQSKPAIPYRITSPAPQSPDSTRRVGFAARSADDGKRVVAALKRAAVLCGAPAPRSSATDRQVRSVHAGPSIAFRVVEPAVGLANTLVENA